MHTLESGFNPPRTLRNAHLQTLVSSSFLRKWPLRWKARHLARQAEDVILQCSDGIRLHGLYNPQPAPAQGLAILLHGWEGCAESSYQISTALTLQRAGFDVFRLHLRDHGPSHRLNPELFNSSRLQEVLDAVKEVQRLYPHDDYYLAGHSLGGNFALRIAARAPEESISLRQVVAVCPVLDPLRTMNELENGSQIYHQYFLRRWKRSLAIKLEHFPELGYGDSLLAMQSLGDMNAYFVPHHTGFSDPESYYNAYALTGDTLAGLSVPAHIILSQDDPMIPADDLEKLAASDSLTVETPHYGGHCGFLKDWRLRGWIDDRLLELLVANCNGQRKEPT
ncbi:MAG: alpha/beta fold hydrolase [Haliea sp.]|jgi:predicted alpha/beta-fold hydrolase|nr:alpha/beta fold hydrolase [Haliea sp.]